MSRTVKTFLILILVLAFGGCCFVGGVFTGIIAMYEKMMAGAPNVPPSSTPPVDVGSTPTPEPSPAPLSGDQTNPSPRFVLRHLPPSWMVLPERPTQEEVVAYQGFLQRRARQFHILLSKTQDVVHEAHAQRFLDARDRVLARPAPYGLWAWPQVRQVLREIGTNSLPLYEASATGEPEDCIAFYEMATNRLAFCPEGLRYLTDADLESTTIHEATHIVLARMLIERSGYSAEELSALVGGCADVAEEFHFTTEGIAFLNQAAYLDGRRWESPTWLWWADENVKSASEALRAPNPQSETYLARRLVWYINQPAENPYTHSNGHRCGRIVAVRGDYAGNYILAMDFTPRISRIAGYVPNFHYE